MKLIEMWHNHPIQSSLEVMLISTAFWEDDATQPSDLALGWRLPTLTDDDGDNFDVSLIDLFMPGLPRRETRAESSTEPPETTPARLPPRAGQAAPDSDGFGPRENPLLDGSFSLHGRININTAAPILLASLLGLDPALASRIAALRGAPADVGRPPGLTTSVQSPGAVPGTQAWLQSRAPHFPPRWGSLSEFVADEDLWRGVTLSERFARIYPFSRMISFHSLSYKVISESLPAPIGGNKNRRASRLRTERIIAGDRGKIETVTFRYW
ncbi:hypothetical protein IIC65_06810 [Candidatus Sumerlaeota bacterium]|nr:hypothetical protein [Candidatus Sumerlaeota bacterium]